MDTEERKCKTVPGLCIKCCAVRGRMDIVNPTPGSQLTFPQNSGIWGTCHSLSFWQSGYTAKATIKSHFEKGSSFCKMMADSSCYFLLVPQTLGCLGELSVSPSWIFRACSVISAILWPFIGPKYCHICAHSQSCHFYSLFPDLSVSNFPIFIYQFLTGQPSHETINYFILK